MIGVLVRNNGKKWLWYICNLILSFPLIYFSVHVFSTSPQECRGNLFSLHRGWVVFKRWLSPCSSCMRVYTTASPLTEEKVKPNTFRQQTRAPESLTRLSLQLWSFKQLHQIPPSENHHLWSDKWKGLRVPELELWSHLQAAQQSDMLEDSGCP